MHAPTPLPFAATTPPSLARPLAQPLERLCALLLALLLALPAAPPARAQAATPDLQGHRGARGLAPENTLAGFARALAVGVHTLELDIGLSADDVVVVSHDSRLNPAITRGADGRWLDEPTPALRELSLAHIQRVDVGRMRPGTRYQAGFPQQQAVDGERIPTLAQVFDLVRRLGATQVRFNIEVKLSPAHPAVTAAPQVMVRALLAEIDRHGMAGRSMIQSFDWRVLRLVQSLAPRIPTAALTAEQSWLNNLADGQWTAGLALADHGQSVPRLVKAAGAAVWSPYFGDLTRERLAEAQSLGLRVVAWTVNAEPDIERLLDWGVDGLISDHPERARDAMRRRGMALPAPVVP